MAQAPRKRPTSQATNSKPLAGDQKNEQQKTAPKKRKSPLDATGWAKRALPVVSVLLAFVGMVLLYRHVFPWIASAPEPAPEEQAATEEASSEPADTGVEDPWVKSGLFTMGDTQLDAQIKAFCDALSMEGNTALQNAQLVYDTIVWSAYEERTAEQKPAGRDWDVALLRHYFSTGNPELGEGGSGDAYEFAAATCYCLRYFGFSDAMAVPVLKTDDNGNEVGSALVIVTDADGERCVCDPAMSGDGWMIGLDRYDTIVVEDIGQDLTAVEDLGLETKQVEQPSVPAPDEIHMEPESQDKAEPSEYQETEEPQENVESEAGQGEQEYSDQDYQEQGTQESEYQEQDYYQDTNYGTDEYSDYGY